MSVLADMGEAEADQFKILAVTSCPTGIAHTYMAAEGIEKAAKAKNCFVKVETKRFWRSQECAYRAGDSGCRLHYRCGRCSGSNGSFRWQEGDSASGF